MKHEEAHHFSVGYVKASKWVYVGYMDRHIL